MIGDDFIKQYLIINVTNIDTEILLISKHKKQYYIKQHLNYEKGTKNISEKDSDVYINEIVKIIKENIKTKLKNIYFNIQNDEIIIRNIKNIEVKRKADMVPLIKYEINQYIPLDLQKYIVKYKKITDSKDEKLIQAILFPKKFVYICKKISENLKIRNKYLHINFDILQKIIDLKLINFTNKDNKKVILIENRKEDMILNEIYENKIIESFIISKANDNNLVNNICNESTYYFGIDDDYIKNLNVRKIQIENKLISYIDDEMKDKTLDYLCVWGMIV